VSKKEEGERKEPEFRIRAKTDLEILLEQEESYRNWCFAEENKKTIKCWECHQEADADSDYGRNYTLITVYRVDKKEEGEETGEEEEGDHKITNMQLFARCPECTSNLRRFMVVSIPPPPPPEEEDKSYFPE
jgi:hypothetical protein